jgi:hypothetical protein
MLGEYWRFHSSLAAHVLLMPYPTIYSSTVHAQNKLSLGYMQFLSRPGTMFHLIRGDTL